MRKILFPILSIMVIASMVLTACAPAATPSGGEAVQPATGGETSGETYASVVEAGELVVCQA